MLNRFLEILGKLTLYKKKKKERKLRQWLKTLPDISFFGVPHSYEN